MLPTVGQRRFKGEGVRDCWKVRSWLLGGVRSQAANISPKRVRTDFHKQTI